MTVRGEHFGDDCFDQMPRPGGVHGALGDPLSGVEVTIVQADQRHLVAAGSADDDYEFGVDVVVPTSLTPGPASVEVSSTDTNYGLPVTEELVVRQATTATPAETTVAAFGTAAGPGSSDQGDNSRAMLLVTLVALAGVALVSFRIVSQRRRTN